jgi:hypothetical protein
MAGSEWCIGHDPAKAEARRRRARKGGKRGGRGRPASELAAVKGQLQEMADRVVGGELDRGAAAVAGQLLNVKLRALEIERRWKETGELEERIQALEQRRDEGGRRYGA